MCPFREKLGKYDAIWDVRSLTAINLEDHIRYESNLSKSFQLVKSHSKLSEVITLI